MRAHTVPMVGVLLAAALLMGVNRSASAALMEKPVLDSINNTIAVLRYHYRRAAEAQAGLELVKAARDLTQRQRDAMKNLYQTELDKGNAERAAFFEARLQRLERHMKKLNEYDFDKTFNQRIAEEKAAIAKLTPQLDACVTEYETLFGKKPKLSLDFESEMARLYPKRPEAAYFLDLD